MFWGVTVDDRRISQTVEQGFRLSMAALENKSPPASDKQFVQVMLKHETGEFLLCTLQHGQTLQQPLDLAFATGEQISFFLNGSGIVHLTGYLMEDGMGDSIMEPYSDSEEESDAPELVHGHGGMLQGKRKAEPTVKKSKKIKLLDSSGNLDDDSDEDDSDEDDSDEEEEESDFSDDFDEEDFADEVTDDEEDEEEDMEDQVATPQSVKKQKQKEKKTPQKADNTPKQANKTPKQTDKTPKQNESTPKQTPKQKKTPKTGEKAENGNKSETPKMNIKNAEAPTTPANGDGGDTSAKKKKKKKKKNKGEAATPGTPGNDSSLNESKSETPNSTPKQNTPKKRVVAGGTLIEDIKIGNGPEAKAGKMVSLYYVGTLTSNNKQFDSCQGGKPFRFRLNQGEVIKGWDNGITGMKVGGKRKITVPASQGYGNSKQGPIPPNSTLSFEVELKAVS